MSLYTSLTKFNSTKVKRKGFKVDFKAVAYILLTFVPLAITWTHFFTIPVEAAWYDPGYSFRKRIPITNSSGSTQTDFQMQTTIDTAALISAAKMQSDCDDIRFTDIGGTSLSYWLEPNTCNTASTIVFFKVPRISSSTLGTTADVYFYYGNPTATSESSTTNTFIRDMDGAVVNYPLDDTTTTQSYSRVVNEGVALGRNIVLNGTFDTDTVWSKEAGITISGGTAVFTSTPTGNRLFQTIPLVVGKVYTVTYTVSNYSAGAVRFEIGNAGTLGTDRSANGTYTQTVVALTNTTFTLRNSGISTFNIDDVSVTQVNIPASSATPTQLLADGNMEAAGVSSWSAGNSAVLTKQTSTPHGGSQVLRVTRGSNSSDARQSILTIGQTYRLTGYARADGGGIASPLVLIDTGNLFVGTTTTEWQPFDTTFVATGTNIYFRNSATSGTPYVEFDDVTVSIDNAIRQGEILQDNDMEKTGTGDWFQNFGGAVTVTKETGSPHGGSQVLRVVRLSGGGGIQQSVLSTGRTYRVTGYVRSDGVNFMQLVHGSTQVFQSGPSTSWTPFDVTFVSSSSVLLFRVANTVSNYIELDDISVTEINPLIGKPTDGVVLGATANGHLSTAYSFDGVNDAVNIYSSDLNSVFNPDEGTVVSWSKVSSSGVWADGLSRTIIRCDIDETHYIVLRKEAAGGLRWYFKVNGTSTSASTGQTPNDWVMFTLTWSKSNNLVKGYINGTASGATSTYTSTWSGNFTPTECQIGSNAGAENWSGLINDVRIYDRALTSTEISDQYSASSDIQAYTTNNYPNKELLRKYSTQIAIGTVAAEEVGPGPVAEWSFDEGQGQVVQDGTRNNNDGVLGANSGISTDDPTWQSDDMCVSGKCLRFDGTNDFVSVPDPSNGTLDFGTGDFSFGTWIKNSSPITTDSNLYCIASKSSANTNTLPGWTLCLRGGGFYNGYYLRVGATDGLTDIRPTTNQSAKLSDGRWHHVGFSRSAGTVTLYVDGESVGSGVANKNVSNEFAQYIGINGGGLSAGLKGELDEAKIYPYARTAAQIRADYVLGANVLGANNDKSYLSDGLVGYWKMDEASWNNNCSTDTVLDSSGNNNHGDSCPTTTGPTGGVAGKFGNGGSFDGINDYVQTTATNLYPFTNNFSISVWMNPSASINASLISNTNLGGGSNGFQLGVNGLKVWFTTIGVKDYVTVGSYLTLNRWQLVTAVMEKDNSVSFYVDGQFKESVTHTAPGVANTDDIIQFGRYNGATYHYNGLMDEVRIYNRGLTGSEVSDLYNWAPDPISHWRMDDNVSGNAQTILDSSINASNATTDDGVNNTGMDCTVQGKKVGACSFDGTDDYITAPSTNFNPTKSWTISTWVNGNTFAFEGGSSRVVLAQQDGTGTGRGLLYIDGTTSRATSFLGNTATYGTTALSTSTWNHISVVYNSATSQVTIYTNGQAGTPNTVTAEAASGSFILGASKTLSVGRWSGSIDDVRIYNYARTQTQILSDMEGNVAGTSVGAVLPDPLAHYKFDEQSGQTVNNSGIGGSSLNGTLGAGGGAGTDDPTWRAKDSCKTNGCLSFDGGDKVVAGTSSDLNFGTESFSISFQALFNLNSSFMPISKSSTGYANPGYRVYVSAVGVMTIEVMDGTNTCAMSTNITSYIGIWTHYSTQWDSKTKTCSIYINGNRMGVTTNVNLTSVNPSSYILTIGMVATSGLGTNGLIDEVKIYNTALTSDQVKLDYNAGSSLNFGSTSVSESSILTGGAGATPNLEWNLDEKTGSTTKDISGNNLTGTINGASWTQGKEGAALRFDGTDDYVTLADNAALNLTTITLEAWVKFNTVNGTNKTIVAKWQPGVKQQYVLQLDSDNKIAFWTGNGTTGGSRLASATTPVANTWYHVVATASGTNKNIYINGRLDATTTSGFALAGSSDIDFSLGSKKDGAGTYYEFLDGSIDKVKVYNYVRSQAQIAYNYNRGLPVGWWKFDECQGTTTNDSSGNGNSGTITVGASGTQTSIGTCNTASTAWGNGAVGKFNSSLNFDGSDDYIAITDPANGALDLGIGDMTIALWARTTNPGFSPAIVSKESFSPSFYGYSVRAIGTNRYQLNLGSGSSLLSLDTNVVTMNTWNHVVFVITRSGNVVSYINGVPSTTVLDISSLVASNINNVTPLTFGKQAGFANLYMNGQIDDIRIYNYPLSPDQVKQVYNGGAVRFGPATGSP